VSVDLSPSDSSQLSAKQSYLLGFWTNALNPKATLFFLSLYTAVVSLQTPTSIQLLYGIWMMLITAAWFALVSWIVVKPKIRQQFLAMGVWVDRTLGLFLLAIAVRLILN
jgi:threonine/homoserine/homoserine lactone efflux protein